MFDNKRVKQTWQDYGAQSNQRNPSKRQNYLPQLDASLRVKLHCGYGFHGQSTRNSRPRTIGCTMNLLIQDIPCCFDRTRQMNLHVAVQQQSCGSKQSWLSWTHHLIGSLTIASHCYTKKWVTHEDLNGQWHDLQEISSSLLLLSSADLSSTLDVPFKVLVRDNVYVLFKVLVDCAIFLLSIADTQRKVSY